MKESIRKFIKAELFPDIRFSLDQLLSKRALKVYVVSDGISYTSEQQFYPLYENRHSIRKKYQIIFRHLLLSRIFKDPVTNLERADVVFLKLTYLTPHEEAIRIIQTIRDSCKKAPLIYFDGDDDANILWPETLTIVDLCVKKHVFKDYALYSTGFIGKNNLTDYVAREYGVSFCDNFIPDTKPIPKDDLGKLSLGYNIGLDKKITTLYKKTMGLWQNRERPNDIVCRATTDSWHAYLRQLSGPLEPLIDSHKVLMPTKLVSQEEYDSEMASSKICISPFGYGEICWRDFEAVLWGCLMVKQNMDHIDTAPNIFIPYETYIPVKWDLSDLAEKCAYYLENEKERLRIVRNAYAILSEFYEKERFNEILLTILGKVGINPLKK